VRRLQQTLGCQQAASPFQTVFPFIITDERLI
jgi:hypothetical protein